MPRSDSFVVQRNESKESLKDGLGAKITRASTRKTPLLNKPLGLLINKDKDKRANIEEVVV